MIKEYGIFEKSWYATKCIGRVSLNQAVKSIISYRIIKKWSKVENAVLKMSIKEETTKGEREAWFVFVLEVWHCMICIWKFLKTAIYIYTYTYTWNYIKFENMCTLDFPYFRRVSLCFLHPWICKHFKYPAAYMGVAIEQSISIYFPSCMRITKVKLNPDVLEWDSVWSNIYQKKLAE